MKTMRHFSIACSLLLLIASCTSAPAATDETQGDFNALDPTLTCSSTDQTGWDFSTGGGVEDFVHDTSISNEIQIVDATYGGGTCDADSGNWTASFAKSCNGLYTCSRAVSITGDPPDPKVGCKKDFKAHYRCGNEPTVYEVSAAAPVTQWVQISCGEKITIVSAVFGDTCTADVGSNFTSKLRDACSGLRRCTPGATGRALAGTTPASSCGTSTTVGYLCGTASEIISQTYADGTAIDFACSANQAISPPSAIGIRIDHATYGDNCANSAALQDNFFPQAAAKCTGQVTCGATGPLLGPTDPSPGCLKNIDIAYHCGDDSTAKTVHIGGEAGGLPWSLTCLPAMHIVSASYGANCGAPVNNATAAIAAACKGKEPECTIKPSDLGDPASGCGKDFDVKYTCGPDPAVIELNLKAGTYEGESRSLMCNLPKTPYAKKACIPKNCVGTERRTADMTCVKDLTRTVIPAFLDTDRADIYYSEVAHSNYVPLLDAVPTLSEDTPHSWGLQFNFGAALPGKAGDTLAEAGLWLQDEFTPNSGGDVVYGFRCLVGYVPLRRYDANSTMSFRGTPKSFGDGQTADLLVGEVTDSILPKACFDSNPPSWRDAAKRLGVAESDVRGKYTLTRSRLKVSFDPKGKTVALRTAGTTSDTALVPNPVGFFYTPSKLWVNFIDYFNQTVVKTKTDVTVSIKQSNDIVMAASEAQFRNPEFSLSLYDVAPQPNLEINFGWTKTGDSPGRNPFSPTATPLSTTVKTLSQRNLGATVEIASAVDYDAGLKANGWVSSANSLTLGKVAGTILGAGSPTGESLRIVVPFSETARLRVFRLSTTNAGWLIKNGDTDFKFRLRVCIDVDDKGRSDGNDNDQAYISATRGTTTYTAGFKGKRCVVSDQIGVVTRRYEKTPFPQSSSTTDSAVGVSKSQGNKTSSTANDMGSQEACQRSCTVDADCPTGQKCTVATTGQVGQCQGTGPNTECTNTDKNTLGSAGAYGSSLFESSTKSRTRQASDGIDSSVSSTSKAFNYTVLDSGDDADKPEKFNTIKGEWPKTKWNLEFSPNWDVIVGLLKGEELATMLSPAQIIFNTEKPAPDIQGLGVGIGKDFVWFIGPVPLIVSLSAGVGFGVAVALEIEVKPPSTYPCTGKTSNCFQASTDSLSLKDAVAACVAKGGYLAEGLTASDVAGIKAASTSGAYWIGAQLAFDYDSADCATTPTQACIENSKTYFKWINNGGTFGQQNGVFSTLITPDTYKAYSGYDAATQLSFMQNQVPILSGVQYIAVKDLLLAASIDQKVPYICEFAPAAYGTSKKLAVGLKLAGAAGFNASACAPSPQAGLCLTAGISFLSEEFQFYRTVWRTELFDANNKPMFTMGSDAFDINLEGKLITGAIGLELKLVFFTIRWEIANFKYGDLGSQTLYHHAYPVWRKY